VAAAALAVIALAGIALAVNSRGAAASSALLAPAAPRTIKQVAPKPVQYVKAAPLARKAKGHPQQAVRYVKAQGHPQQAVRYVKVPAHYVEERVRAPPRRVEKRIVHGKVEYVMVPAQMHRGRRGLRRQELRIGAKGVRRGVMLDDEEEPAEGDEEEAPAAARPGSGSSPQPRILTSCTPRAVCVCWPEQEAPAPARPQARPRSLFAIVQRRLGLDVETQSWPPW